MPQLVLKPFSVFQSYLISFFVIHLFLFLHCLPVYQNNNNTIIKRNDLITLTFSTENKWHNSLKDYSTDHIKWKSFDDDNKSVTFIVTKSIDEAEHYFKNLFFENSIYQSQ